MILTEPTPLNSSMSVQDLTCATGQNGIATVNVSGGIAPYNYAWNTTSTLVKSLHKMACKLYKMI